MREFSADTPLSKKDKIYWFFLNFFRGIFSISFSWSPHFHPKTMKTSSDSPGRLYIDAFLKESFLKFIPSKSIKVLDIGCGSGYIRSILADLGFTGTYLGVDVTEHQKFSFHKTTAFASTLTLAPIETFSSNGTFDLVSSVTSLEHIQSDKKAIELAHRYAKKQGGVEIHLVPSFWALFTYLFHGYRQYSKKRIQTLLKGTPYSLVGLGGIGSFFVHLLFITFPERILPGKLFWRDTTLYTKALSYGFTVDRFLPFLPLFYAVIVKH